MRTIKDVKYYAKKIKFPALIIIAFVVGFIIRGGKEESQVGSIQVETGITNEAEILEWTCSMHPQIRMPNPGKCPICGMDLIPVMIESAGDQTSPREIKLSPAAVKLAEIQVAPVERKFVYREIRMVGKVEYDETRLGYITAWLPGRIDRLYVDYTGISVRKGDHLVDIYSPDLLTAQEELIQALTAVNELKNSKLSTIRETAIRTVEASREKLRLLGMTPDQIKEFEERGKPADHVTIYSPMEGIVIHKNAVEGIYVNTGSRIYTIADLSHVWVMIDVYESDLEWIRYGQEVEFYTEAYPGEVFKGKIAFIDPVLNDKTRTVKVRVNVSNTEDKLKPNMFVRALVHSRVAAGGKVMDPSLTGKFMCPMHPEIVKDIQDSCDLCGMDLVKVESLGYANPDTDEPPLVIPASAPLITGKRAVVYVSMPGREGSYEGREVVLGPRAGDYYLIKKGLDEGELVVVNGNFKIDSAVQILAKPSMMNPEGGITTAVHHSHAAPSAEAAPQTVPENSHSETENEHEMSDMKQEESETKAEKEQIKAYDVPYAFKEQLDSVFEAYFAVQYALSHDNVDDAIEGGRKTGEVLKNVDMMLLTGDAHVAWMKELNDIQKTGETIASAKDIAGARQAFIPLSNTIITVAKLFGTTGKDSLYIFHCPMADNNKGADWLQNKSDLENPFFGSAMLKCGELVETLYAGQK